MSFSYAYTRVVKNPMELFSENTSLARVNSNQLDISYQSWTIGYHSYSLSLRGETEVFHIFFLSRGYAADQRKACLSKSKFCLSFQLANKINSNLTCTIKQSNPMNTILQRQYSESNLYQEVKSTSQFHFLAKKKKKNPNSI